MSYHDHDNESAAFAVLAVLAVVIIIGGAIAFLSSRDEPDTTDIRIEEHETIRSPDVSSPASLPGDGSSSASASQSSPTAQ